MYCSFRPLSGNYISQWFGRLTVLCEDGRFPSPVGELHFSIGCAGVYSDKKRVSVPCRGTTFLNFLAVVGLDLFLCRFRPLSGNYISQWEYHRPMEQSKKCFRPLSGNYISQSKSKCARDFPEIRFPSPVGELHFSIEKFKQYMLDNGFRPLSGNYISQW